ncbi:MAG: sulfur oxidation c-type cytochrome SoxA [Betaproteobacteria bacterium]|nr:sulfur oxidation c-type cytochrome SoxA [Betaproteobacteria bacterium]
MSSLAQTRGQGRSPAQALPAAQGALPDRAIAQGDLKSGREFLGADVRAMQADEFSNPGMLWVERGEKLWNQPAGTSSRSCADCHGDAKVSMRGVAARYPAVDTVSSKLFNLEDRVRQSRAEHQGAAAPAFESEELLALVAFVAHQSRGSPVKVVIDGPARPFFDAGRSFYYRRVGQMNLACAHCHEANWGKTLYAERISQGHPNAYPAYRLEWQSLGSVERRLRSCLFGVRAELPPPGTQALRELSLFLAWRAEGLPIEAPGVRR